MRSAAFSRSASQRAASLEAPCTESTYTEAPVMLRSAMESACTDTNMSARATRARRMRSRSSRNSSRSRVSTARMPGFRVDALGERARDRERHVLLARAAVADGAGVLAAVACVHRDDDVAAAFIGGVHGMHRLRCPRSPGRTTTRRG